MTEQTPRQPEERKEKKTKKRFRRRRRPEGPLEIDTQIPDYPSPFHQNNDDAIRQTQTDEHGKPQ